MSVALDAEDPDASFVDSPRTVSLNTGAADMIPVDDDDALRVWRL